MRAKPKFDVGDKVDIWSTKHESGWMPLGTIVSHGILQGLFGSCGYNIRLFRFPDLVLYYSEYQLRLSEFNKAIKLDKRAEAGDRH